ncbi:MAG: oligosaccharide flippase family protein [Ignavibacteriaceae bacterium]
MFEKLKQLTVDTAVYGVSTMVGRFLNFILVPFFTNIFLPSDYGIIQIIYAYVAILNIVYIYGMDSAYLKFAAFKEIGDDKDNFSTPYISVFVASLVLSFFIILSKNSIVHTLGIPTEYHYLVYIAAGLIFLDSNAVIPYLKLRLDRQAKKFSLFKILQICVNIILNLYFILILGMGIEAIVISNLLASLVALILLVPTITRHFRFRFNTKLFKRLFKFGLPFLPAGLSVMVVQVIDVPILEKLTTLETVGVYKANYKLGIFMMLFVNMFQYAWQPFFLHNANEPNVKEMFAKILTYFTITGSIILVVLSLFITDIAKIQIAGYSLIGSLYWGGLYIVPIILLSYLINGMYVIFSAGIYIEEKSIYVPLVTGIGAVINIGVNFTLIPLLGITGAAIATLASYLVMAVGYYVVTQKFYNIRYEYECIAKVFLGVLLAAVCYYSLMYNDSLTLIFKGIILIGYLSYLYFVAMDRNEIKMIKQKLAESKKGKV